MSDSEMEKLFLEGYNSVAGVKDWQVWDAVTTKFENEYDVETEEDYEPTDKEHRSVMRNMKFISGGFKAFDRMWIVLSARHSADRVFPTTEDLWSSFKSCS